MTGDEAKELLIQSLRAKYWLLQRPEDVEQAFADALAALEPCVVLTAEEARDMRYRLDGLWVQAYGDEASTTADFEAALALLTPEKVTL